MKKKAIKRLDLGSRRPVLANLGCGSRIHPDWVNLDLQPSAPGVFPCDLSRGLPFEDGAVDVAYSSHVLEHFARNEAPRFLRECFRALRPGGVIRLAVPDLEGIVREYVEALRRYRAGEEGARADCEWIVIEMFDQTVRDKSGGAMVEYLRRADLANEEYILKRLGAEAKIILDRAKLERAQAGQALGKVSSSRALKMIHQLRRVLRAVKSPRAWREQALRLLLGDEYQTLLLGRFRLSGEVHRWMWDSCSLGNALRDCGFEAVEVRDATSSSVENWASYLLDTEADGSVRKPDSLFIEARKPGG
jgi:SAM-dependent methyltransferase